MVRSTGQRSRGGEALTHIVEVCQRFDLPRDVIEPDSARHDSVPAARLEQSQIMVVGRSRVPKEGATRELPRQSLEPEHVLVEMQTSLQVRHIQDDMIDAAHPHRQSLLEGPRTTSSA